MENNPNFSSEEGNLFLPNFKEIKYDNISNYFFQNNSDNTFKNPKDGWHEAIPSYSNGAAYADLDNDGDLDLIVNNVNSPAFLLKNQSTTRFPERNYISITFEGDSLNPLGIGTKALLYTNAQLQQKEVFTTKGYLSAVAPQLHFGWAKDQTPDSITIVWPNGTYETIKTVPTNRQITINASNASGNFYETSKTNTPRYLEAVLLFLLLFSF